MPYLVQKSGLLAGSIFAIQELPAIIGRSPKFCDVVLNFMEVSRRHARITMTADQFFVEDLGSQNRTAVNKTMVDGRESISHGDDLWLGGIQFEFRVGFEGPETDTGSEQEEISPHPEVHSSSATVLVPDSTSEGSNELSSMKILSDNALSHLLSLISHSVGGAIPAIASQEAGLCWYKPKMGNEVLSCSLERCFSRIAIEDKQPLIIEDMTADARTCELPAIVNEPHMISTAMFPFLGPDQQTVTGAVGVATTDAKKFTETELTILRQFKSIVSSFFANKVKLNSIEDLLRQLLDDTPSPIWVANGSTGINWVNQSWLQFTGKTESPENRRNWRDDIHPDDVIVVRDFLHKNWQTKPRMTFEFRLRNRDGEYRLMESACGPRTDEFGNVVGYIGTCSDISDEVAVSEELCELSQHLRQSFEESPNMIAFLDDSYRITNANASMLNNLETHSESLRSQDIEELFGDGFDNIATRFAEVARKGKPFDANVQLRRRNGDVLNCELLLEPFAWHEMDATYRLTLTELKSWPEKERGVSEPHFGSNVKKPTTQQTPYSDGENLG